MNKEWAEPDKKMADILLHSVVAGLLQVGHAGEQHEARRFRAFLTALETSRDDLGPEIDGVPLSDWLDRAH